MLFLLCRFDHRRCCILWSLCKRHIFAKIVRAQWTSEKKVFEKQIRASSNGSGGWTRRNKQTTKKNRNENRSAFGKQECSGSGVHTLNAFFHGSLFGSDAIPCCVCSNTLIFLVCVWRCNRWWNWLWPYRLSIFLTIGTVGRGRTQVVNLTAWFSLLGAEKSEANSKTNYFCIFQITCRWRGGDRRSDVILIVDAMCQSWPFPWFIRAHCMRLKNFIFSCPRYAQRRISIERTKKYYFDLIEHSSWCRFALKLNCPAFVVGNGLHCTHLSWYE